MFFLNKKIKHQGAEIKLSALEYLILLRGYQSKSVGISRYKLISELEELFSGTWIPQSGTMYPLFNRLLEKKYFKEEDIKTEVGPVKKVFKITNKAVNIIKTMVYENFEPEMKFMANYLEFIVRIMIKLSNDKDIKADIKFDEIQNAMDLFIADLNRIYTDVDKLIDSNAFKCPACHKVIDRDSKFCKFCGNTNELTRECKICRMIIDRDAKYCPGCGTELESS